MATDFTDTKFLTYKSLKQINESSVRAKRNKNVYFNRLPIADDGTMYPISFTMVHNDKEIRASITLNKDAESILLDMSFQEYEGLPTFGQFQEALANAKANEAENG